MNSGNMRVSDAERAEVADRLAANFADGRLDQEEYDERISRAMSAKTQADFDGLFDDLPGMGAPTDNSETRSAASGTPGLTSPRSGRRRGPLRLVLTAVLVLVALSVVSHIVTSAFWFFGWFFNPWWILALVAVIVLLARHRR